MTERAERYLNLRKLHKEQANLNRDRLMGDIEWQALMEKEDLYQLLTEEELYSIAVQLYVTEQQEKTNVA